MKCPNPRISITRWLRLGITMLVFLIVIVLRCDDPNNVTDDISPAATEDRSNSSNTLKAFEMRLSADDETPSDSRTLDEFDFSISSGSLEDSVFSSGSDNYLCLSDGLDGSVDGYSSSGSSENKMASCADRGDCSQCLPGSDRAHRLDVASGDHDCPTIANVLHENEQTSCLHYGTSLTYFLNHKTLKLDDYVGMWLRTSILQPLRPYSSNVPEDELNISYESLVGTEQLDSDETAAPHDQFVTTEFYENTIETTVLYESTIEATGLYESTTCTPSAYECYSTTMVSCNFNQSRHCS